MAKCIKHAFKDVSLNAKIRILKQITTRTVKINEDSKMLVSMQRYEF